MEERGCEDPAVVGNDRARCVARIITIVVGLLAYTGLIMFFAKLGETGAPSGLEGLRGDLAWMLGKGTAQLEARGLEVVITSGYRSWAEQDVLYGKGRTSPGQIVTRARGGKSRHNYGQAVDIQVRRPGQEWRDMVSEEASVFRALGCAWGGDWGSFQDPCHLEIGGSGHERGGLAGAAAEGTPEK